MNASKNIQNIQQTNSPAASEDKSNKDEGTKMTNENNNIQMNTGALTVKSSMRFLGGLALAGMLAFTATFGTVSADSPSVSTTYVVHGPNQMDVEFLNNLGNIHINLGPDVVVRTGSSKYFNLGPDIVTHAASTRFNLGPDVVEQTASAYINLGPDVVEQAASLYVVHGPDTSEWNG